MLGKHLCASSASLRRHVLISHPHHHTLFPPLPVFVHRRCSFSLLCASVITTITTTVHCYQPHHHHHHCIIITTVIVPTLIGSHAACCVHTPVWWQPIKWTASDIGRLALFGDVAVVVCAVLFAVFLFRGQPATPGSHNTSTPRTATPVHMSPLCDRLSEVWKFFTFILPDYYCHFFFNSWLSIIVIMQQKNYQTCDGAVDRRKMYGWGSCDVDNVAILRHWVIVLSVMENCVRQVDLVVTCVTSIIHIDWLYNNQRVIIDLITFVQKSKHRNMSSSTLGIGACPHVHRPPGALCWSRSAVSVIPISEGMRHALPWTLTPDLSLTCTPALTFQLITTFCGFSIDLWQAIAMETFVIQS